MRHERCDAGRHERKEMVPAQKIRRGETRRLVVGMNCNYVFCKFLKLILAPNASGN